MASTYGHVPSRDVLSCALMQLLKAGKLGDSSLRNRGGTAFIHGLELESLQVLAEQRKLNPTPTNHDSEILSNCQRFQECEPFYEGSKTFFLG